VKAADRPYGEFYDFYSVSIENFRYHIVKFVELILRRICFPLDQLCMPSILSFAADNVAVTIMEVY